MKVSLVEYPKYSPLLYNCKLQRIPLPRVIYRCSLMMVSSRILAALAIALRVVFEQLPGHVNGRICLPLH